MHKQIFKWVLFHLFLRTIFDIDSLRSFGSNFPLNKTTSKTLKHAFSFYHVRLFIYSTFDASVSLSVKGCLGPILAFSSTVLHIWLFRDSLLTIWWLSIARISIAPFRRIVQLPPQMPRAVLATTIILTGDIRFLTSDQVTLDNFSANIFNDR